MKRNRLFVLGLLTVALVLAGCSNPSGPGPNPNPNGGGGIDSALVAAWHSTPTDAESVTNMVFEITADGIIKGEAFNAFTEVKVTMLNGRISATTTVGEQTTDIGSAGYAVDGTTLKFSNPSAGSTFTPLITKQDMPLLGGDGKYHKRSGGPKPLQGSVTISPTESVTTGTALTANYIKIGTETVTYQWNKDETAISAENGGNNQVFTPFQAGSYTVTVSAAGYTSKTSDPVSVTGTTIPELTGTITITPNTGDIISDDTMLTASYTGGTETVTYQWYKNGAAVPSATSSTYTPPDFGSYTVTVSATGFRSKTSAAVTPTIIGIKTLAQLNAISTSAENLGRKYKLLDNITGVTTPIGDISTGTAFSGDFDGNGKSIAVGITSGSTVDGGEYGVVTVAGLFAASSGSIHNLTVTGTVNVSGSGSVLMAGGVVGALLGAEISKVASSVAVTASGTYVEMGVGGVAGVILPGATINSTNATGAVTATSNGHVTAGGIAGSSQGTINNVYTTGNVSGTTSGTESAYVGGIVGSNGGSVSYAYATGTISAAGTGTGIATGDSATTIGAGGIAGAGNAPVRYTVSLNSNITATGSTYNRCSFRITSTRTGNVITNGATNYGKSDLTPTGWPRSMDKRSNGMDGVDVTVTSGSPYTAPTQDWWKNTGFAGSNWTTVWDWNSTKGLPTLR